jgi:hypothetical protein
LYGAAYYLRHALLLTPYQFAACTTEDLLESPETLALFFEKVGFLTRLSV